ncbi:MAG: anion permease [Sphingobacteriales bacterium]|nr:anion permease [Sphingobacteriales bacterium]
MAWGILILFGGGLALAKGLEEAGLIQLLGKVLAQIAPDNLFLLILLITTLSIFISEVMSNVAQVIIFAPVVTALAISLNIHPCCWVYRCALEPVVQVCCQWERHPMPLLFPADILH